MQEIAVKFHHSNFLIKIQNHTPKTTNYAAIRK